MGNVAEWLLFLIPPGAYQVRSPWRMAGTPAPGSNTIVTDNVFVPSSHVLRVSDLRDGKGPGGALSENPMFRVPFYHYAPLTFAAAMLGAAKGAYEHVLEWTKTRKAPDGSSIAEKVSVQVRMARTAADLDLAELLLRRGANIPHRPVMHQLPLLP